MNAPTIIFRCDASATLGLGHLMRCIALAEALRASGARLVFVVRSHGAPRPSAVSPEAPRPCAVSPEALRTFAVRVEQPPSAASSSGNKRARKKGNKVVAPAHVAASANPALWCSRPRLLLLEGAYAALSERQFECVALPIAPPAFDETLDEVDASALIRVIRETNADAVVVDHYGADERYLDAVRSVVPVLGVVDDLADRSLHACDWVLNPSPAATGLPYRFSRDVTALLGPTFALLRPEFSTHREATCVGGPISDRSSDAARVLVTLGGGNQTTRINAIVDALSRSPRSMRIRFIGGASEPGAQATGFLAGAEDASTPSGAAPGELPHSLALGVRMDTAHSLALGVRIEAIAHQPNIAPLLAWADVVVTGGGATCWELCAVGVPQVAIALEANQEPNVAGVAAIGAGISLGRWNATLTPAMAANAVESLLASAPLRSRMSQAGRSRVDGAGADRAAQILLDRIAGNRALGDRSPTGLSSNSPQEEKKDRSETGPSAQGFSNQPEIRPPAHTSEQAATNRRTATCEVSHA